MTTRAYVFTAGELLEGDPLSILEGGDELGTLAQAMLVSLLTWRRAADDDPLPSGSARNGWWADALDAPAGSRLWLLGRSRLDAATVAAAREYAEEALAWLVADGLAARVEVQTERRGTMLALGATAVRADGSAVSLRFPDVWSVINA